MLYIPQNEIATALLEARRKIERREKWACGHAEFGQGRACLIIAMGDDRAVHLAFARANGLRTDRPIGGNSAFNDTHSHEEIMAALDRAIVAALTGLSLDRRADG